MKSYGHVNMLQNQVQNMALEMVSNFPATPVVGQLVFKEKILYICAEIAAGLPAWIPLTNEINTYIHAQGTTASTWTVNHGLNTTTPTVQVYQASDNKMVIPGDIQITSNNQVVISFGVAVDGRAVVMIGNEDGNSRPAVAFTFNQTSPSATWTINHNLGYSPIVRVFVGTEEVQPNSISFPTMNTTVIGFLQPYVGVAQCI